MLCNVYKQVKCREIDDKKIKEVVFAVLKFLKKKKGEVSVHLVGDKKIKSLNFEYRKKNKVTDVLSFAAQEGSFWPGESDDLGDVFICVPQVTRQSKERKIKFEEEFVRMLVHGILHINGYDHVTIEQEKEMFGLQEKFVRKFV